MKIDQVALGRLYPQAKMIPPMKIHPSTDSQLRVAADSGQWFGQLKKDGFLYIFERHFAGNYLFSRTVSKKTGLLAEKSANVPHIVSALEALPDDTIILGEIYYPGKSSKNVTEILGCLPDKAIKRQTGEYGLIHYYIYDILRYDGIDFVEAQTDNLTRYKILCKIYEMYGLSQYDFLELAETWYDNLYERVGDALASGEEGMVFKLKTGIYEPDKRPMSNLKAKQVDFLDAIIIGFEPPTKEYKGKEMESWEYWINAETGELFTGRRYEDYLDNPDLYMPVTKAFYMNWTNTRIQLGAYNNEGKVVYIGTIHSGIDDGMKKDMTEHPENWLNKVCKIQCMEKDNKALTIRHGFYKGLHESKNPEDCVVTEIFE